MTNDFTETLQFANFCLDNPELYRKVKAQGSEKIMYAFFRLVLFLKDRKATPYHMGQWCSLELIRIFDSFPDSEDARALKFITPRY